QRAFVPLLPIALATGWSALVFFALRIPLNPMSVVLGALVIAISTEFSVLLAERYRAERIAGHEPGEALQRTYRSTGAAVLASGTTAIAGFAVLVVSDIKMLRGSGCRGWAGAASTRSAPRPGERPQASAPARRRPPLRVVPRGRRRGPHPL